ncbi:MAG: hypothetical protein LBQ11_00235 [Candidatus Nomurabacteria bacterium]|jgi:hypothetical protein|nr:hypothetical protein [Candidatus Nomurabacteria bacterium]
MQKISIKDIKRALLIATITLFSVSTFLAIIFVLLGTDETGWRIMGTTAILGLLALLSMNNVFRLENEQKTTRILSTTALISNVFWSIPWIFLVWNLFKIILCGESTAGHYPLRDCSVNYYTFMDLVGKIAITAGIISATSTVVANFLTIKNYSTAIKALRSMGISCAIFSGVYFMPAIWLVSDYLEWSWRLFAIACIVLVFSCIVTPILAKVEKGKMQKPVSVPAPLVDEAKLREEIEAKVRAEITAEREQASQQQTESNDQPEQQETTSD